MKRHTLCSPLVLLTIAGCSHSPKTLPEQAAPVAARVITVASSTEAATLSLTGSVVSRQLADISSQVMAPVSEVRVHEGDVVRKGEVLVRLSSATLAAGLQQAQAQVAAAQKEAAASAAQTNLARQTYARYEVLHERHSVTPHELDQMKAQLEQAQAQEQAAGAQVQAAEAARTQSSATNAYTVITAPFSGVVTGKYVDPGAMAAPGTPLLRIENAQALEVDLQVNESSLRNIRLGEAVPVRVEGAATPVQARVRAFVPAGDPAAHTFTVKIGLPALPRTYSGMTADVQIPAGEASAVTIPISSVRQRGQMDAVLALDGQSVAQLRYVSLGRRFGDAVEVLSGLQAGGRVLAEPSDALIGRRIEPQR